MHDHRAPLLFPTPYFQTILPQLVNAHVELAPAIQRLETFASLSPTTAIELTKAAREYAAALWIADDDPQTAWLRLVTAVEILAVHEQVNEADHVELFTAAYPKAVEALHDAGGDAALPSIARQFAPLIMAGKRFRQFTLRYAPSAPDSRPTDERFRIDWDDLDQPLKAIYGLRSDFLHEGKPFPSMMVFGRPGLDEYGQIAERTSKYSIYASGTAAWGPAQVPMYLWTFAYLVRGALLNWWEDQVSKR